MTDRAKQETKYRKKLKLLHSWYYCGERRILKPKRRNDKHYNEIKRTEEKEKLNLHDELNIFYKEALVIANRFKEVSRYKWTWRSNLSINTIRLKCSRI